MEIKKNENLHVFSLLIFLSPFLSFFHPLKKNKHVLSGYLCQPCARHWEHKTNKPWFLPSRGSQSRGGGSQLIKRTQWTSPPKGKVQVLMLLIRLSDSRWGHKDIGIHCP